MCTKYTANKHQKRLLRTEQEAWTETLLHKAIPRSNMHHAIIFSIIIFSVRWKWLFPTENDVWSLCGFVVRRDRRWPRARSRCTQRCVHFTLRRWGMVHMRDAQRQGTTDNHGAFLKDVRKTRDWYFTLGDFYNPVRIWEEMCYVWIV